MTLGELSICPKCGVEFVPTIKHGYKTKYCSRSCANSKTFSEATNELKREKNKIYWNLLPAKIKEEKIEVAMKGLIKAVDASILSRKKEIADTPIESLSHEPRRLRILMEQENKCNRCGINSWLELPITLELEHKDGNRNNNSRDNLEALCPNCHSLTSTFRGKNKKGKINHNLISDMELLGALMENPKSIRKALLSLDLTPKGGNYSRAKKLLKGLDIYEGYAKV